MPAHNARQARPAIASIPGPKQTTVIPPGGAYPANVAAYINGVFRGTIAPTDHMPAGLRLYLP